MKDVGEHSRHVFQEDPFGFCIPDNAGCIGPEVALVCGSLPLAGDAVRLARDTAHDEIHRSTPRPAEEGSEISPKRCRIKPSVRHPLSQDEAGRRF
jgi:hypothetical protein